MAFKNVAIEPQTGKKTYSQEEAYKASQKYFMGDDLAARVWVNKYALTVSYTHLTLPTNREV